VTLTAKWNSITCLQDGLFDGLQSLVTLDLSYNHINSIGLQMFSNSSDLTSLRSLNLAYNRLTSIEPWWYYRCILGNKNSHVTIDLRRNLISNFTNNLKFQYRCGMKPLYGFLNLDYNRISHIMDLVNGWNIGGYPNGGKQLWVTFICLYNYEPPHRYMRITLRTAFDGGAYKCDCTDFMIYRIVKYHPQNKILDSVRCSTLQSTTDQATYNIFNTPGTRATSVSLKKFVCEYPVQCPSSCRCIYRPANATLHVYCSSANLSSLPLELPPLPNSYVKYKLDFSNNKLFRRLEHRPYFVNTSILDVSNCGLTEIALGELKDISRLSVVNLRGNMLQTFPRRAEGVNISARLLIGVNPWRCSCDNSWMIGWLQSLSNQLSDQGDIVCRSPSRMYGRNVLKSTAEEFCVDPVERYVAVIVSLTVAIAAFVLLVIAGLTFYKFRVKFYKKWKFHPFDRDECIGEDMDYDVFLCFSSEDENPHAVRILELIESKGYRVCYHVRDFRPGLILDNIAESIRRSKRTICLVSANFLTR